MRKRRDLYIPVFDEHFRERFWSKVDQSAGPYMCWPWKAGTTGKYGMFRVGNSQVGAHVIAYCLGRYMDHLPELYICHDCNNPLCCNPFDLREDTHSSNMYDAIKAGTHYQSRKTHCKYGHEYTEENTGTRINSSGGPGRYCKTCNKKGF